MRKILYLQTDQNANNLNCVPCHISEFKIILLRFSTYFMLDNKGLHIVGLNALLLD